MAGPFAVNMEDIKRKIRTETFVESLYTGLPEYLSGLEKEARSRYINIIRPGTQQALRTLLAMLRPATILEVGAAIGFSALFMAEYSDADITTIEHDRERAKEAKENILRNGREDRIQVLEGDAEDILPALTEKYDLIFMDAAKGQYINFLPEVKRLLKEDGILISDNVMQGGDIIESHYAVERRDRTIYKRMREYLYELTRGDCFTTTVFTIGDGLAVSVYNGQIFQNYI